MIYIWLGIVLLLIAIEVMTVNLTTIWFVISGIIAMILSCITDVFVIQFACFVIIGIILLITTKPLLQKKLKQKHISTNADRVIGMSGIVTEEISKNKSGEVKVDGKLWTATSTKSIAIDSIVEVLEIDGVKLKVKEKEEE